MSKLNLTFEPVTAERWSDFETLFGARGACGGCWCMLWRLTRAEFEKKKGAGNKRAMKRLILSGVVPGIIAYDDGEPAAWCSVAPREHYPALERSRILSPVDDKPVWSVTCLFVRRDYRRRGVSVRMLDAAARYVASEGGRIVEGYPYETKDDRSPDAFVWTGLAPAFVKARFKEVARRSKLRPIMRRTVKPAGKKGKRR